MPGAFPLSSFYGDDHVLGFRLLLGAVSGGADPRKHLRPDRPGLHHGLRHHRTHQLRPRRNLHDRGLHGPDRHRGVDDDGLELGRHSLYRRRGGGGVLVGLRLHGRKNRLQALAQRAASLGPDQRHRHVALSAELRPAGANLRFSSLSRPDSRVRVAQALGTHRPFFTGRHLRHHRHRHDPVDDIDQVQPDRKSDAGRFRRTRKWRCWWAWTSTASFR